jgi:zinc transport system ATP-binding protein
MPPLGGRVERASAELKLAYLAQHRTFDELYPLTAWDVVAMGVYGSVGGWRLSRKDHGRVRHALELLSIGELSGRPFRELSEGQRQRVLFARVAAAQPDLAVLDEPTSAMDVVAERETYELIGRLRHELRMTVVVVSHDLGLAREFADRALLLDRQLGAVIAGAPREVLEHAAFRERYGSVVPPGDL